MKLSGVKPDPPSRAQNLKCGSGFMPNIPSSSERHDNKQGVAGLHHTLMPPQDDRAAGLRENRRRWLIEDRADYAQGCTRLDDIPQSDDGFKSPRVRRRMVRLQMSFFGIGRLVKRLNGQRRLGSRHATEFDQQILQSLVQVGEVGGQHFACTATLRVDGSDLAVERGTQGASRQVRARPAPERIKAGCHGALGGVDVGSPADDVADPRMKFEGLTAAVQVDVMGRVSEDLSLEEVSQSACRRTLRRTGKGPSQIFAVDRMTTLFSGEGRLVEHRHDHDGAAEIDGLPRFYPLAQKRGAFIFVTVRRAVDHQRGTGLIAPPDPRVEAEVSVAEPMLKATDGERGSGQRRRSGRVVRHD